MNKCIRLLFENMTDDLFNDGLLTNDEIYNDISSELFDFKLGEILYNKNIPYAICCGEKNKFTDNKERFLYLYNNTTNNKYAWTTLNNFNADDSVFHKFDDMVDDLEDKLADDELPCPDDEDYDETDKNNRLYFGYQLLQKTDFMHIDEDGYYNT